MSYISGKNNDFSNMVRGVFFLKDSSASRLLPLFYLSFFSCLSRTLFYEIRTNISEKVGGRGLAISR